MGQLPISAVRGEVWFRTDFTSTSTAFIRNWSGFNENALSDGVSVLPCDIITPVMLRVLVLSTVTLCLYASLPCAAQSLAPVIRLSADEATKAKQLAQNLKDAKDRSAKAKVAWGQFHQTYQSAHPDLPGLRFTADFRLAFALLNSSIPEVRHVATIELTAEERKKLEALHREMTESEQSQTQAEKTWREFQYQLVVDHVGTSNTEGANVTLAGKQIIIPNPWGGGLAFTSDFQLAFPQLF